MRARADARGYVERRGRSWFLKRRVEVMDAETGVIRRKHARTELGSVKELRTWKQARAAADAWLARTRTEIVLPGPQIMAIAYFEQFTKTRIPMMPKPSSQLAYRSILRKHLVPAVAGKKLVELDTKWIGAFLRERLGRMERATLANIRTVLLQVLRQAWRDKYGVVRIDPRDVRIPKSAKPKPELRYFKAEDLQRILEASVFPWRALWALMGYAGLRIGEALGLEWGDVDLARRLITVRRNAVRGKLGAPKTESSAADVPILPVLEDLLRQYVTRQSSTGEVSGLLFRTRNGTPYYSDDVRRRQLQPLLRRTSANRPDRPPPLKIDLRRTHSELISARLDRAAIDRRHLAIPILRAIRRAGADRTAAAIIPRLSRSCGGQALRRRVALPREPAARG